MTDKEKIKAEIERRKKLVDDHILSDNDLIIGERNAYVRLLSFIDSMQEEQPAYSKEEYDLAKAAAYNTGKRVMKLMMEKEVLCVRVEHDCDAHGADYGLGIVQIKDDMLRQHGLKPDDVAKIIIMKEE